MSRQPHVQPPKISEPMQKATESVKRNLDSHLLAGFRCSVNPRKKHQALAVVHHTERVAVRNLDGNNLSKRIVLACMVEADADDGVVSSAEETQDPCQPLVTPLPGVLKQTSPVSLKSKRGGGHWALSSHFCPRQSRYEATILGSAQTLGTAVSSIAATVSGPAIAATVVQI